MSRLDAYSELGEALGCDPMDSHEGRLATARELRRDSLLLDPERDRADALEETVKVLRAVLADISKDRTMNGDLTAAARVARASLADLGSAK